MMGREPHLFHLPMGLKVLEARSPAFTPHLVLSPMICHKVSMKDKFLVVKVGMRVRKTRHPEKVGV